MSVKSPRHGELSRADGAHSGHQRLSQPVLEDNPPSSRPDGRRHVGPGLRHDRNDPREGAEAVDLASSRLTAARV